MFAIVLSTSKAVLILLNPLNCNNSRTCIYFRLNLITGDIGKPPHLSLRKRQIQIVSHNIGDFYLCWELIKVP